MEKLFFYAVLDKLIKRSGLSLPYLEQASGVPHQTIESWQEGRVKQPRKWLDLLRLAKAMRLSLQETNENFLNRPTINLCVHCWKEAKNRIKRRLIHSPFGSKNRNGA